jgi:hypothetical protein
MDFFIARGHKKGIESLQFGFSESVLRATIIFIRPPGAAPAAGSISDSGSGFYNKSRFVIL